MVFILDRSGSMVHLTTDTIGGFNSMLEDQKSKEGDAFVTTILFDNEYEILHDHLNIQEISPLTTENYYARGSTALLDAIGKTIQAVGNRLNITPEEERPENVIFIITTDGMENSSLEYQKDTVKEMIEHQQEKYAWTFIFLGANMDAVTEASALGIPGALARTYTADSVGTQSIYEAMSDAVTIVRNFDDEHCVAYPSAKMDAVAETLNKVQ